MVRLLFLFAFLYFLNWWSDFFVPLCLAPSFYPAALHCIALRYSTPGRAAPHPTVDKSASQSTIKKAYRRLSRKYHPDKNKEPGAEERFVEVARGGSCV